MEIKPIAVISLATASLLTLYFADDLFKKTVDNQIPEQRKWIKIAVKATAGISLSTVSLIMFNTLFCKK